MAQVVSITIGGKGEVPVTSAAYGFPVQSILLKPAPANTKFNNVVMLTEIVYQQTGLQVNPVSYFSPTALATIITACNA